MLRKPPTKTQHSTAKMQPQPALAPCPAIARAVLDVPEPAPKPNFLAIDRDPAHLHPIMRAAAADVLRICDAEKLPFKMFEGFRYPQRQADMYCVGRLPHKPGPIVTDEKPWMSLHNFGLAADFGLFLEGKWVWADNSLYSHLWERLAQIGLMYGLEGNDTEKPHLQIATMELRDLQAGRYPGGGDLSWESVLKWAVVEWPIGQISDTKNKFLDP